MNEIRFDTSAMREDHSEAVIAWTRGFGVDPSAVKACGLIVMGERSYQLHLSEILRDDRGKPIVDHAINEVVSKPLIIDTGSERSWPAFLNKEPFAR